MPNTPSQRVVSAPSSRRAVDAASAPRPPFWTQLSVPMGSALQGEGVLFGALLLVVDAHLTISPAARVTLMLVGWLAIYCCCHALAHYAVGRLVGIHFRAFGLRGTDHPENYFPPMRQLMQALPTFTAMTEKESMRRAGRGAKALMFAAGETSTAVCSTLAGWYAWQSGIPGGWYLFVVMIVFNAFSTVMTALVPRGDYAKAIRALRAAPKA